MRRMSQFSAQLGSTCSREFADALRYASQYQGNDAFIWNAYFFMINLSSCLWTLVMYPSSSYLSSFANLTLQYLYCKSPQCWMNAWYYRSVEFYSCLCDTYSHPWYGYSSMSGWSCYRSWTDTSTMTLATYQVRELYCSRKITPSM